MKKNIGFYPGDILIPKENLRPRFSVVACDQFTAQPDYWQETAALAEGHPSAYHMIFPEALLEELDFGQKVASIQETTRWYLEGGIFDRCPDSFIYLERTLRSGQVRKGLLGVLDLECYDYKPNSRSLTRATEGTVLDRIPPRVKIREGAFLEMPHIMLLVDDPDCTVVEPFAERKAEMPCCYDFDLMMGGGHLAGWQADGSRYREGVSAALAKLADSAAFNKRVGTSRKSPILFAVGDGNHSAAAAKACWEAIKPALSPEEIACHPARWMLVEVCNLHDESLAFEPVHRALFGIDHKLFLKELTAWAAIAPKAPKADAKKKASKKQSFTLLMDGKAKKIIIHSPSHSLTVGSVQVFLDSFLEKYGGSIDYIHGSDVLEKLCSEGAAGILLPAMEKSELFRTVAVEGALPRKTFSMGEAWDKRYYLECREIR